MLCVPDLKERVTVRRFSKTKSGGKRDPGPGPAFPASAAVFSDAQLTAYEDLDDFKAVKDEAGLSLECIKLGLKVGLLGS
jgi:hypothetical protein